MRWPLIGRQQLSAPDGLLVREESVEKATEFLKEFMLASRIMKPLSFLNTDRT